MKKLVKTPAAENLRILEPLSLWKWLTMLALLLGFPFLILIDQMVSSFRSSRDQIVSRFELEVEKISGRAFSEQEAKIQVQEILEEYLKLCEGHLGNQYIIHRAGFTLSPIPFLSPESFRQALLQADGRKLRLYEKRLKRLIPGIKLLKWDSGYKLLSDSDVMLPKFVYLKMLESVFSRLKQRRSGNEADKRYMDHLPLVQKFYNDDPNLVEFIKFGRLGRFTNSSGLVQFLFWHDYDMAINANDDISAAGFLAAIDEDSLPLMFGIERFSLRKSQEWEKDGYALGWIDCTGKEADYLPYPFSRLNEKQWARWIGDQPNGVYEKDGLLISLRRVNSRLVVVAARSLSEVDRALERQIFITYAAFFLILAVSALLIFLNRRNEGMALSIKWQILWLFVLVMALPTVAVTHFGRELLKDRRQFYENEVFKKLERIRKDIEENKDYVFRHMEILGDEFTTAMLKFYKPDRKRPFAGNGLEQTIGHYFDKARVEHLYLFDAAGNEVLKTEFKNSERRGLLPLVTSLAKLKLRLSGKLVQDGYSGAVSLMDLMLEETGGAKLADIQAILKTKNSSAFELKFTNRKTYFFVGEFSPPGMSGEVFIMVFIIKDRKFDQLYLELMLQKLQQEEKTGSKVQLFYGKNAFSYNSYFIPSTIKNPFFEYSFDSPDSLTIGKMIEPTRYAGTSIKDSCVLQNGRRFLLYSFSPAGIESYSALLLYDYAEIAGRLESLRVLLVVISLVILLIVYVLVKIAARSIVEPIQMLQEAVERVRMGDYSLRLQLPGEDELVELSHAVNSMSQGLDEREKMTKYLSKSAVEAVKTGDGVALGGRKVPASILFSDIRSFTTISESHDAEAVVKLLNEYFACMNVVIEQHDGDIDKFIGDAIMAQFIARDIAGFSARGMALKAVKCALAMMKALADFNSDREKKGLFPIMIGVGINSGEVIAGNIGSPGRMDHTVIGDVVNVASRLEGMSKLGKFTHVIISRSTLDLISDRIKCRQLEETAVKGKTSAVEMYEVLECID
ncbi:MAG: adenylate/guanylate cyclase domain-containing protein [Candidatus Riflebacteria bacterium]